MSCQNAATGRNGWNRRGRGLQTGPHTSWRAFSHLIVAWGDDSEQRGDPAGRKWRFAARRLSHENIPVWHGWSLEKQDILESPYLFFPPSIFGLGKGFRTPDILLGLVRCVRAPVDCGEWTRFSASTTNDLRNVKQLVMHDLTVVHACIQPYETTGLARLMLRTSWWLR